MGKGGPQRAAPPCRRRPPGDPRVDGYLRGLHGMGREGGGLGGRDKSLGRAVRGRGAARLPRAASLAVQRDAEGACRTGSPGATLGGFSPHQPPTAKRPQRAATPQAKSQPESKRGGRGGTLGGSGGKAASASAKHAPLPPLSLPLASRPLSPFSGPPRGPHARLFLGLLRRPFRWSPAEGRPSGRMRKWWRVSRGRHAWRQRLKRR